MPKKRITCWESANKTADRWRGFLSSPLYQQMNGIEFTVLKFCIADAIRTERNRRRKR